MDCLTFIAKLAETLAWPVVVVMVFFGLKDKGLELIPILRKLKYKEFEAEFGEGVREIGETLPLPKETGAVKAEQKAEPSGLHEQLLRLAETAPRAAVLEAWLQVEHAAQRLVSRTGVADRSLRMVGPSIMRTYLERTGALSPKQQEGFNKLRALRNKVVHYVEVSLPLDEVLEYVELALALAAQFDKLRVET